MKIRERAAIIVIVGLLLLALLVAFAYVYVSTYVPKHQRNRAPNPPAAAATGVPPSFSQSH